MSTKAGNLLWNRKRITLDEAVVTIDTGLRQANQAFGASSDGEPTLGTVAAPPGPPLGQGLPSRVQVIPLAQIGNGLQYDWTGVLHGEPFVDPDTGTVKVAFYNTEDDPFTTKILNVLFWDPHSAIGPGEADTYQPPIEIQ